MSHSSSYDALDKRRAARLRRRHRLAGVVVVFALAAAILWARGRQLTLGDDAQLARGAAELWRAVRGEAAAYDRARAAFERAARSVVFDPYPAFALTLAERLARGETHVANEALQPAVDALARGDLDTAERLLEEARDAAGYAWLARLVADMRAAAALEPAPTPR